MLDRGDLFPEKSCGHLPERVGHVGHQELNFASAARVGEVAVLEKSARVDRCGVRAIHHLGPGPDECAHLLLDDAAQERIVRATEDHHVDACGRQRREVALHNEARDVAGDPAFLCERDEQRRGLANRFDARRKRADCPRVGSRRNRSRLSSGAARRTETRKWLLQ